MTQPSTPTLGVCSAPPLSSENQWTIRPSWMRSGGQRQGPETIGQEKTVISYRLSVISYQCQLTGDCLLVTDY
jgi:hypothetical protein